MWQNLCRHTKVGLPLKLRWLTILPHGLAFTRRPIIYGLGLGARVLVGGKV